MTYMPVVVIVDDDVTLLSSLARSTKGRFELKTFSSPENALNWLAENHFDVDAIISDLAMPEMDGISFFTETLQIAPSIPRILLSGRVTDDAMRDAINQAKVARVLMKPASVNTIQKIIDSVLNARSIFAEQHSICTSLVRNAIDKGDFDVALQERFDASSKKATGFEALCRFPELQSKLCLEDIIGACEGHPCIHLILEKVVQRVLSKAGLLRGQFGVDLDLSINVSPFSLTKTALLSRLLDIQSQLKSAGIRLEIEVTERDVLVHSPIFAQNVGKLRDAGIVVLMDDFGIGNNSIQLIDANLFDGIKIDKSIISKAREKEISRSFVKWVVESAHQQGMKVVAEGVEDFETSEMLSDIGVDEIQGYFLHSPVPIDSYLDTGNSSFAVKQ